MIIKNGTALIGKRLMSADVAFDRVITAVGSIHHTDDSFDATDCYVVPGFVEIHSHGAMGHDFTDGDPDGLQPMADYYAAHGVTSFLATTMTAPEDILLTAVTAIRDFQWHGGSKCAGIHLEGPFLSTAKKGAQKESDLHAPDVAMFYRLNEASGNQVKLVTVACEEPGGMEFVQQISKVCTVSLGHTVADYDTAMEAFRLGASHATHLFNGMDSLHHRKPGVIAAALDSGASVELICDGLHIHPAVIRLTHQLFGDKLNIISDSLRCAGMPDGEYELSGQQIEVHGGRATLLGTDTLAGSCVSILDEIRNVVGYGIPLDSALYAASTAPADAVKLLDRGRIAVGQCADLLVLDQNLQLKAVFIDGKLLEN